MNKSPISMILATLLATSGFAMAQSPAASTPPFKADGAGVVATPATGDAKTRAEVKSEINAPNVKAGSPTQDARARSEATVPAGSGGMTGTTRAEVKGAVNAPNAQAGSPTQDARARSEASVPAGSGGMSQNSRADVKAGVAGSSSTKASSSTSTAAERKARRAERKAMRNSQSKAKASNSTSAEAGGAASKTNAP